MKAFTNLLLRATKAIQKEYFMVETIDGRAVYRERVYCYELYHQLRTIWPESTHVVLNGELDKRSHPFFVTNGIDPVVPDFLVHSPASMKYNYCAIEVKCSTAGRDGIRKDLTTLSMLHNDVGYRRCIYLIFGSDVSETITIVRSINDAYVDRLPVELWTHTGPNTAAQRVRF